MSVLADVQHAEVVITAIIYTSAHLILDGVRLYHKIRRAIKPKRRACQNCSKKSRKARKKKPQIQESG